VPGSVFRRRGAGSGGTVTSTHTEGGTGSAGLLRRVVRRVTRERSRVSLFSAASVLFWTGVGGRLRPRGNVARLS